MGLLYLKIENFKKSEEMLKKADILASNNSPRILYYLGVVKSKLDKKSAIQALVKPVRNEGIEYDSEALDLVLKETDGYPYFLQVWGSHIWEVADSSPITTDNVSKATSRALKSLDMSFFKVRVERLTERQLNYVLAMTAIEKLPANSTDVARILGISVSQAAPLRDELIRKGMAYSPKRGLVTFSVPKFKEYIQYLRTPANETNASFLWVFFPFLWGPIL